MDKMNEKYKKMEAQLSELFHEKLRFESEGINLQTIILEKEEKLKVVSTELKSTKKSLRIMNSRTKQLDQLLIMETASSDYHGLRYNN